MMVTPESRCMGCMEPSNSSLCSRCGWREGTPPASAVFLPPRTILDGRYLLGKVLGAGGFGITYLAWDLNLSLKLAIKEYFPNAYGTRDHSTVIAANTQSKEAFDHGLTKFLEEGRALAMFHGHPGIASVMTFFRQNGTSYLVMKYEDGITLQQYLKEHGGRIDFKMAMSVAMPVMDALRAVHQEGILHRDISPDNIIINRNGQIKILDFGSAKRDMTSHDRTLQITLKRGYSPEEQYRGNGRQGRWTDVYAVGATFYHAITGTRPPDALERLDHDTLQPFGQLGVQVPKNSEKALMKALAIRAPDRFQTIEEFQSAIIPLPESVPVLVRLRKWLGPTEAGVREWLSRHLHALAWASSVLVVLIGLILLLKIIITVPQILQFDVDPSTVAYGQAATMRWSVAGGKVSISPGIGPVGRNTGTRQVSPSVDTTYVLTARGAVRSVTRSVKIAVTVLPLPVTLTADPPTIKPGESAELTWSVSGNPSSVTIDQGVGSVKSSDSLKVSPTANTTYTLTAEGPGGARGLGSVMVLIAAPVPRPVIVSLNAQPLTIKKGQSSQLMWEVTGDNNTAASFDQDIGKVALKGIRDVTPVSTTRYKLSARNPGGPASKYVTVQVLGPDPPTVAFSVAPTSIAYGQSATLTWSVSGEVDTVNISPGIGSVPVEGKRQVSPHLTTTYVISAKGPGGPSISQSETVQVSAPRTPDITFTASSTSVAAGKPVTLRWKVGGDVETVTLNPGALQVQPEGSRQVNPVTTTQYTLIASGPGGTVPKSVDVQVLEPFDIVSFDVTPLKIKRGEAVTISWKVSGPVTGLSMEPDVGSLLGKNSPVQVKPEKDTIYFLTARAGSKVLLSRRVKVTVKKK
jgi:serine/threonine protein kinase/uncharacterized cupredoxin-like copper-binding protein